MQSYGIPADRVAQISGIPVPGNLYVEIATRLEKTAKKPELVLYDLVHLPETVNLYYTQQEKYDYDAKVIDVLQNKMDNLRKNILILDRSAIYPTSGG